MRISENNHKISLKEEYRMKMPIIESYLDDLIKNSTLDVPAWNIEAARKGGKSGWNYIDGCMILAMIETWKITGEKKYLDFVGKLDKAGVEIPIKHMCNSAGIIEFDDNFLDMVRSGIMTYGLYPSEEVDKSKLELHPALELKSHIAYIKSVGPGFTVSYGSTFTSKSNMRIATVPVGYGDGYPRALSNKGKVLIHGKFANIIGRVCMDQFMVDVTDIPEAKQGDEVTLIGKDQDNVITVEDVADNAHSFNYEFCCGINRRVPRVYYKDGKYLETVDYLD